MKKRQVVILFLMFLIMGMYHIFALPDFNNDYKVNNADRLSLLISLGNFPVGTTGCLTTNNFCEGADVDINGKVEEKDLRDFIDAHTSHCSNFDNAYVDAVIDGVNKDNTNNCNAANKFCNLLDVNFNGLVNPQDVLFFSQFFNRCNKKAECQDNQDNDNDGLKDTGDNDCIDSDDKFERPSECTDLKDNDNDGNIDTTKELNPDNGETIEFEGSGKTANYILNILSKRVIDYDMPYNKDFTPPAANVVLMKDSKGPHLDTIAKYCEVLGYRDVVSYDSLSGDGRRRWTSPNDNGFWLFDTTLKDFILRCGSNYGSPSLCDKIGLDGKEEWLVTITCKNRLSQCNDEIDNDNDGKRDFKSDGSGDTGCVMINDDSEISADSDCSSTEDYKEGPAPHCSDGSDNDDDDLIDMYDPDCWSNPLNTGTYVPGDTVEPTRPACSDGQDNDGDSNIDTQDSGCCTAEDTDETDGQKECLDGCDNDGDNWVDKKDPDCWASPNDPSSHNPQDNSEGKTAVLNQAYWATITDESTVISSADLKDSVKLIAGGSDLQEQEIEYTIIKSVDWWFDKKAAQGNSRGHYIWKAGQNQADKTKFETGGYYFKAKMGSIEKQSGILTVNAESNSHPIITFISLPKDRQIYFKDEILTFEAIFEDVDDEIINYKFVLGEGNVIRQGTVVSGQKISFIYPYPTTGQKNILITADDGRGGKDRDKISILVIDTVDSDYALSYIDVPAYGAQYQSTVSFDSRSSYAVNEKINGNSRTITCEKGFCPKKTEGCPPPAADYPNCQLSVVNAPDCIKNCPKPSVYDTLDFTWVYDNNPNDKFTGTGLAGAKFDRTFATADKHTVVLTTKYRAASSDVDTDFFTSINVPTCKKMRSSEDALAFALLSGKTLCSGTQINNCVKVGQTYWFENNVFTRADNGQCYKANGVSQQLGSETNCCIDSLCNQATGICEGNYQYCSQLKSQSDCDSAPTDFAFNQLKRDLPNLNLGKNVVFPSSGGNGKCRNRYSYDCEWELNIATNKIECSPKYSDMIFYAENNRQKSWFSNAYDTNSGIEAEINLYCQSSSSDVEAETEICIYQVVETMGDCANGDEEVVLKYKFEKKGTNECPPDGEMRYSCGHVARLPYFGIGQFILSALLIVVIYFVMLKKRK